MPSGLQTVMRGGRPSFAPELFPGAALYVDSSRSAITKGYVVSGTGATLSKSGDTITMSGATGMVLSHNGGTVILSGYANAGNNGKFTILTATTNGCTFTNAAGAAEAGSGAKAWSVEGQCVGITDLVSGQNLTNAGAITSCMSVCTSDNAGGIPVLSQGQSNGARYVSIENSAIAGLFNGAGPHTYFSYFKPITFNGFQLTPIIYRDTVVGVSAPVSYGHFSCCNLADSGINLTYYQAASTGVSWSAPAGYAWGVNGWNSLATVNNGAGTVRFYVNGVFHGQASGTVRSLVNLSVISVGLQSGAGSTTPANIGHTRLAVAGSWNGDLGASRIADLHAYYQSRLP